jgi:hypothetical protein
MTLRALFVVDAEGFTRNRDADLPGLHTEIRRVIETACERSGLAEEWKAVRFLQGTGDGVLAVLPLDAMGALICPFVDRLQEVLAEAARDLRARGLRLRLRVAFHHGFVDDEDPVTAGISTATNDVCRLLDCEPLRAALRESDPDLTFVAAAVSAETFEAFVRAGRTDLRPSQFRPVWAKVKQFDRPAFLYVPSPSWREEADDKVLAKEGAPAPAPGGASFAGLSFNGDGNQNAFGNRVGGDFRQERS